MSHKTRIEAQRRKYLSLHQQFLKDALHCGRDGFLLEEMRWYTLCCMLTRLTVDVGCKDAATIVRRLAKRIEDGEFGDHDGTEMGQFEWHQVDQLPTQ